MAEKNQLEASLGAFSPASIEQWSRPCRPRILVVTDGALSFRADQAFGLLRFVQAITNWSGVSNKPILTLAYRGVHIPAITIDSDTYNVKSNFDFSTATPAVTVDNYDQLWLFGYEDEGGMAVPEIDVIAEFMNSGGGVFATGDHGGLGKKLSSLLPRIRHMREWQNIPMGIERDINVAVKRIDTVVNPGANGLFEFDDQSDDIPQRIYPNYRVTAGSGGKWQATVHPLLMLPGATAVRLAADGNAGFTKDIDVLPDHPHESVCYDVKDGAILNGSFTNGSTTFVEFQPSVVRSRHPIGADIVAYAVSGGRSVKRDGAWKPPVTPRMFGAISAYDGRQAVPYRGKRQRPGRIVCESTWHHYVNTNLDGTGSETNRSALGTWSGGAPWSGTFTPSASLEKIYQYYTNIISWLQPANRVTCSIFRTFVALRYSPALVEELVEAKQFKSWHDFVGLGQEVAQRIEALIGQPAVEELVDGLLLSSPATENVANLLSDAGIASTTISTEELRYGVLGGVMARLAVILPASDLGAAEEILEAGPDETLPQLLKEVRRMLTMGMTELAQRANRTVAFLTAHKKLFGLEGPSHKAEEVAV